MVYIICIISSVASSSKGVGMGISLMMFQAGALAGESRPLNTNKTTHI
jgi:hypothetical protein